MNIKSKENKSKKNTEKIAEKIFECLKKADKIVIGAGAGLSASAGLDYHDEELMKTLYKPFYHKGYSTIVEGISQHWYLTEENARLYWGFWAHHIFNIYHDQQELDTYKLLYHIFSDMNYFIITTNADGQFYKDNYDKNKLFSMQGSYGKFQCQHGCSHHLYNNETMIHNMLNGFDEETLQISQADIPRCPECGQLLSPNLRIDQYFVEDDNQKNKENYWEFIDIDEENVVFLELGVGFNTPGIIRYPFEEMVEEAKNGTLIRVNLEAGEAKVDIKNKIITAEMDISKLLNLLVK